MYKVIKSNWIASASIKRISGRLWSQWFDVVDKDNNIVDLDADGMAKQIKQRANNFFNAPTFHNYVYDSLYQIFASWKKYSIPGKLNSRTWKATKDSVINVLDSRIVNIDMDKDWEPKSYRISNWLKSMKVDQKNIVDYIVYKDADAPLYWVSIFESVVHDALIDIESSGRQLLFFQNSAVPNAIVTLDPDVAQNEKQSEMIKDKWEREFKWNTNSNKVIISNAVKDVKTLDVSNKELQLIDQRLYSDKKMWVAIWIDLRLLWYMKDSGSAFSDISFTTYHANEQLDEYSKYIADGMKLEYEKFVDNMWDYKFVLKNEYYNDVTTEKDIDIKQIQNGIMTRNEYRKKRWELAPADNEVMDKYLVPQNYVDADTL